MLAEVWPLLEAEREVIGAWEAEQARALADAARKAGAGHGAR